MAKLDLLRVFLNERLTAAAAEIFGAVEKTVVEYQEENHRLRGLLRITPGIKLYKRDSLQLSLAVSEEEVPSEQQHCEQEWSPSLGQEDPEPTQIKEEQEEVRTSQKEEQLQGLEADIIEFQFTPSCVKSECDQEDPLWSLTLPQTQTVENRESDPKHFGTVTHLKGFDIPCDPPDNQSNASSHSSAKSSDPLGHDSSQPLDLNLPMGEHCSKPSTISIKAYRCRDCGKTFPLKAGLQRHVNLDKKRLSECHFCKKQYNSTCKLKAHARLCHGGKPSTCPFCGKTFKHKGHLSRHMSIHTGEKPFSCGDCGKSFNQKGGLGRHILTHTGEKPFSCHFCCKSFRQKRDLRRHILIHTGEKPYSCGDCGKGFIRKEHLTAHMRTHTGE
ncbi:zinc finger protein 37-like isoform X1 [Oncorhynchus kisutch]|uniref:zinc finger protein 37-like isoform X1 n=1 Tax=Oncorhynchus kisutch TaxID=8019 RepID=UPI00099FE37F|nr:zinc finger protein 37-like isoform X1 [Oncorhynchus kisutch]